MTIYKPCDIRGNAEAELNPDLYRRWGVTLGRPFPVGAKFVVGGDVRPSTPDFLAALVEGLASAGMDVVDVGQLPTPMIYYARRRLDAVACAAVTASHNAAQTNGLKWMIGDRAPEPDEVLALRDAVECQPEPQQREGGTSRTLDVTFDYVAWLQETWIEGLKHQMRVVLDPMFGCYAARGRRYLQAVFPRSVFSAIHDEPDPNLGGQSPDCSRHELLHELSVAVEHEGAHLGIAFDGDGDRVAFVDHEGSILTAEEITCVLLHSFGEAAAGQTFVHDLKFSDRVPQVARSLGANPVAERSGHAFLRRRMQETGALFGAEVSGHYYFRALDGGDDGMFAACWMLDFLSHCGRSLAELRRECPAVVMTPDLRVPADAEQRKAVLEHVARAWHQYPQSTLDGIRVEFPRGWALVRGSLTEPGLTFRFEADEWSHLRDIVWQFCEELGEIGDGLWMSYTSALGGDSQ